MLVCCWSAKGGAGTTVVATTLALLFARRGRGALLVDLAGDVPAVLGLSDDRPTGVAEWLQHGASVPADGLARLEIDAGDGLALLARGAGELCADRAVALAMSLAADPRPVVVDAGVVSDEGAAAVVAAAAHESLLVTRACFLALRRALVVPLRPSAVVLVAEEGRAITAGDIETALAAPVRAQVSVTAQVARAVDAGVLRHRVPRSLERELRDAA